MATKDAFIECIASIPGIFSMLYREFWSWVAIANLIACPIAYPFMKKWLPALREMVVAGPI